jgi:hypothetical protein
MVGTSSNWENDLESWLKPFLDRPSYKAWRRMSTLYVAGLIGPGDRKSVAPYSWRSACRSPTAPPANRILVAGSLTFVSNDLQLGRQETRSRRRRS